MRRKFCSLSYDSDLEPATRCQDSKVSSKFVFFLESPFASLDFAQEKWTSPRNQSLIVHPWPSADIKTANQHVTVWSLSILDPGRHMCKSVLQTAARTGPPVRYRGFHAHGYACSGVSTRFWSWIGSASSCFLSCEHALFRRLRPASSSSILGYIPR